MAASVVETPSELENDSRDSIVDRHERQMRTPLPKFQLAVIMLICFSEPIAATVIYPFINKFVRETGVINGDEKKTGYYAGMIVSFKPLFWLLVRVHRSRLSQESVFFLAESLTVVQWGYLSDRYGRRPILVIGPLGLALSLFFFGISTSFWPLVVFRCLQGTFNGNVGQSLTLSFLKKSFVYDQR